MTQATMMRESGPDDAPTPKKRRLLPKILIGVAVVLVVALGAGLLYAATIDRSLTTNPNRGVELAADEPCLRRPKRIEETGKLDCVLRGSDSREPGNEGSGRSDT